jgi:hypothetical protein
LELEALGIRLGLFCHRDPSWTFDCTVSKRFWGTISVPSYRLSGILTEPPVATDLAYNILEPAVDADGNDIDGVRSTGKAA